MSRLSGEARPRTLNVVQNPQAALRASVRPVSVIAPEQAEAASPISLEGLTRQVAEAWEDATDDMRESWTNTFEGAGWEMPASMREWAAARAQSDSPMADGTLFGEVTGGALGPSPFRWNMGSAGAVAQPGPQGAAAPYVPPRFAAGPPPPGAAAAAAAMGGGFFGVPPGGAGGAGGIPPMGPPPGGAAAGAGGGPFAGLNKGQYNRSYAAIRQDLLRMDVPEKQIAAIEDQYELDFENTFDFINSQKTELQNRLGATPVRALSTAVGQFIAQRVARGPAQAAQRRANLLLRQQERAAYTQLEMGKRSEGTLDLLRQERATGISVRTGQAITPEEIKGRQRELAFFRSRRNVARAEVQGLQPRIKEAVKETAPLSLQLANLAALTPAIVAGGVLFQAAMAGAQAGLDALGKIAMEGAEAGTGFNATLRRTQDALAQEAMETGGVRGAVARGFQAAGMEATGAQRAALEGRVAAVTATNRAIQQRDMLRSLENINLNAPAAARYGIDAALVRPTGGFMGTAIGAQQSLDEIIGNEMERLNPTGLAGVVNWLQGNTLEGLSVVPSQAGIARAQAKEDYAAAQTAELAQAGNTARLEVANLGFGTPERTSQADALDALGANEIAAAVRGGAYEFKDANGQVITEVSKLAGIIKDLGEALVMPSGSEAYRGGERQRRAQMMGFENQYQNQTQLMNPVADWRRLALNRPLPFGTTFDTGDAASARAREAFGGAFQDAQASLNARMAQGRSAALELGVSQQDITRLEEYGQTMASIRGDLVSRRLEVNTYAYNQQLTVARRQLGDIVGLVGRSAEEGASAVGLAERENLVLERRNTILGRQVQARQLDLQQRQINFNLATSQFTTGGATPAEAAARMEQARLEAQYEQANLNDQREMFENEGVRFENQIAIVDEQNLRALQDAVFAIQQIERERDLEKYTAAAEEYMGVLQQEADILGQQIDADIARGMNFVTLAQDEIRRVYLESGEVLTGVTEDIADAFKQIRKDYDTWLGDLTPLNENGSDNAGYPSGWKPYGGAAGSAGGSGGSGGFATGGLFNTSGPYDMTVGEAGTETVAVLRNPRQMMFGGGSGSGAVTININNPTVRNDGDIAAIARAVEETLRQRAVLVRPR